MSIDFDNKKDPGEAECWIYKISLMPMSGLMSWLLGFNLIIITWHNNRNNNNNNNKNKE